MVSLIKNLFSPTERNNGIPLLLTYPAVWLYWVLCAIIFFSVFFFRLLPFAALIDTYIAFTPAEVITYLNAARESAGVSELVENKTLAAAAEKKAKDMLARGYFAHTTPDGKAPWSFLDDAGYRYSVAGENLAVDFISAKETHAALMESPSHRTNIVNPRYQEVGVAVEEGVFRQGRSIIVVQFFGMPRREQEIKPPTSPPSIPAAEATGEFTVIQLGSSGNDVRELQQLLAGDKEIYPEGLITGYFGMRTEQAIARFQKKFGITAAAEQGKVGKETREKITQAFARHIAAEPVPAVLGAHIEFPRKTSPFTYLIPRFFSLFAGGIILTALTFLWLRNPASLRKVALKVSVLLILFAGFLLFPIYALDTGKISTKAADITVGEVK